MDSHNAIGATTLRGTSVVTYKNACCGNDIVGQMFTDPVVLATDERYFIGTVTFLVRPQAAAKTLFHGRVNANPAARVKFC